MDPVRRALVPFVACSLVTILLAPPAAATAGCSDVDVPLRNFKIDARWKEKAYRIGDNAQIVVRVTRTAEEDPVTEDGTPYPTGRPMNEPAADVRVGVGLFVGGVFLSSGGITDDRGRTTVSIKIRSYARPDTADSEIYAEKIAVEDFPARQCRIIIREYGRLDPGPRVKITR